MSERAVVALLLTGGMVFVLGLTRRSTLRGMPVKLQSIQKAHWQACADVVLAGDSRVGCGVSPAEMKPYLKGQRIYNYFFTGNGYSQEYLEAIENVLDPTSKQRMIILGISPQSLTPLMTKKRDFHEDRKNYAFQSVPLATFFRTLLCHTAPMTRNEIFGGRIAQRGASQKNVEVFADGWMATYIAPSNYSVYLYDARHNIFNNNCVSAEIVANVMGTVARWRQEGIRVYAFRPPTVKEMVAVERELSGFDEEEFKAAFQHAGGIWLDVDPFGYPSHDGCHLRRDGAVLFTRDLSEMIQASEKERGTWDRLSLTAQKKRECKEHHEAPGAAFGRNQNK
jgi:hypothetical protein